MRKTVFNKRQRERFLRLATELLCGLGAEPDGDSYLLRTRAGRLVFHPTGHRGEGLGTVFGRFDEPEAARRLVDCNPFSGKWNHHYFGGWTVESAIADLSAEFGKVLAREAQGT